MAHIKQLDQNTINKIAAGEVIERPCAVVKELVENAIDAKSNAITIEIKDGGISLIRITDNGCGINEDDIETAFLRHATSKIKSIEDLFSVTSLGFRGEALSSIAAVAQVELITKETNELMGTRYVSEGGKESTFMGLTGVGDLIVTCNSIHSRNFQAGLEIGKDDSSKHFLQTNTKTVEGIRT